MDNRKWLTTWIGFCISFAISFVIWGAVYFLMPPVRDMNIERLNEVELKVDDEQRATNDLNDHIFELQAQLGIYEGTLDEVITKQNLMEEYYTGLAASMDALLLKDVKK